MAGLYRLARQSESGRRAMTSLDLLVRAFFRACSRRTDLMRANPPQSVAKVADRNVKSYVEEINRRLMNMWGEENERMVSASQQWDKQLEVKLEKDGPSGLIEYQA